MIDHLISVLASCVIGWLFIVKIPQWLNATGVIAIILKVIGILVILSALLSFV